MTSLTSQGHSVFKDVEKIPTGSDFGELISTEITGSDFFIVLLTKASTAAGLGCRRNRDSQGQ